MEKFSGFNDSITGINPFVRRVGASYALLSPANPLKILSALNALFFTASLFAGTRFFRCLRVEKPKKSGGRRQARTRRPVLFYSYTSALDVIVLNMVYSSPDVVLVEKGRLFEVNCFNMKSPLSMGELEKRVEGMRALAVKGASPVILLLEGGMTNGKMLLDIFQGAPENRRRLDVASRETLGLEIEAYGAIKYAPEASHDIAVSGRAMTPPYKGLLYSAWATFFTFFHLFASASWPRARVVLADTLQELSDAAETPISEGMGPDRFAEFADLRAA